MDMWVGTRSAWHSNSQERRCQTVVQCTYVSGLLLYKVCINYNQWQALHMQFRLKQRVLKQYVLRKYFRDLQLVVEVKTVCAVSVKEEAVLERS